MAEMPKLRGNVYPKVALADLEVALKGETLGFE